MLKKDTAMKRTIGQGLGVRVTLWAVSAGLAATGCSSGGSGPIVGQRPLHCHDEHGGSRRQFYARNTADPDWLVAAATFHGHLGPWVTVGGLIGRDAVARLETPGHWKVDVICWMPPEKQCKPFSCILDGLQVTSGATLGKQNIRFGYSPEIVTGAWPVVYVIRSAEGDHAGAGVAYGLKEHLVEMVSRATPETLEEVSRAIVAADFDALFEVWALSAEEMRRADFGTGVR